MSNEEPDDQESSVDPAVTPELFLDIPSFAVSAVKTLGYPPGWIHSHDALLEAGGVSILIRRGKLDRGGEDTSLVENIDDWRLHLSDWRWERLTERRWPRWEIIRRDKKPNHLWQIQQAIWSRSISRHEELETKMQELEHELGSRPDLDLVAKLFSPETSHEKIPENEDEYNVSRIKVQGVVVRYAADSGPLVGRTTITYSPRINTAIPVIFKAGVTSCFGIHN